MPHLLKLNSFFAFKNETSIEKDLLDPAKEEESPKNTNKTQLQQLNCLTSFSDGPANAWGGSWVGNTKL